MIIVTIPTAGRPTVLARQLLQLKGQDRPADHVVVSATGPEDLAGVELPQDGTHHAIVGPRGISAQRNAALDVAFGSLGASDDDVLVMLDDDMVLRRDWLGTSAALLSERPDCVAVTGVLLDDGVQGPGLSFEEAAALLAADRAVLPPTDWRRQDGEVETLYGCNIAFRGRAVRTRRFDERLPRYSWLEDADLSGQLRSDGRLLRSGRLVGVHLGVKMSRSPGADFGYSQVANNLYLMRKGTLPRRLGWKLMRDAVLSNLLHWPRPEPWIDRRGRLKGNLRALRDELLGGSDPARIGGARPPPGP